MNCRLVGVTRANDTSRVLAVVVVLGRRWLHSGAPVRTADANTHIAKPRRRTKKASADCYDGKRRRANVRSATDVSQWLTSATTDVNGADDDAGWAASSDVAAAWPTVARVDPGSKTDIESLSVSTSCKSDDALSTFSSSGGGVQLSSSRECLKADMESLSLEDDTDLWSKAASDDQASTSGAGGRSLGVPPSSCVSVDDGQDMAAVTERLNEKVSESSSKENDSLESEEDNPELLTILPKRFKTAAKYVRFFGRLLESERAAVEAEMAAFAQRSVTLRRWDPGDGCNVTAFFAPPLHYNLDDEREDTLQIGGACRLRCTLNDDQTWHYGLICLLPTPEKPEIAVSLKNNADNPIPFDFLDGFDIEFLPNTKVLERLASALESLWLSPLARTSSQSTFEHVHPFLFDKLLGNRARIANEIASQDAARRKQKSRKSLKKKKTTVTQATTLDESQNEALQEALRNYLTLIQGPPGTGKSVTSTTIIKRLLEAPTVRDDAAPSADRRLDGHRRHRVLVCSPSNTAVDQLTERLSSPKEAMSVVRIFSYGRQRGDDIPAHLNHLAFHTLLQRRMLLECKSNARLAYLLQQEDSAGLLARLGWATGVGADKDDSPIDQSATSQPRTDRPISDADAQQLRDAADRATTDVLMAADVVLTTCSGASVLTQGRTAIAFSALLIDEATQASEVETLVPILQVLKACVLRRRPLPRVVLVGDHKQLGPFSVMHSSPVLRRAAGRSLYARLVELGTRPVALRTQYRMHPRLAEFPAHEFYAGARLQDGVTGQQRRQEARCVEETVVRLLTGTGAALSPAQIGVITPYDAQRSTIRARFAANTHLFHLLSQVEVSSVDGYQGREKDVIVLSTVRSSGSRRSGGGIGFVDDPNRLNVSLTRARYGLVIVGNARTLATYSPLWRRLVSFFRRRRVLVGGATLDRLTPVDQSPHTDIS